MLRYHWIRPAKGRNVFSIFDRKRGFGDLYNQTPIARCYSLDDAERIVEALNAKSTLASVVSYGAFQS